MQTYGDNKKACYIANSAKFFSKKAKNKITI